MKYQKKRRKKRRERERERRGKDKKKDNQISDAEISRVCVSVSVQRVSSCVRNAVKFHATHTRTQFIRRFIGFLPALSFVDRPPATSFFFFSFVCLILRYDRMISSWGNAGGHRWFFSDSGSLFFLFFIFYFMSVVGGIRFLSKSDRVAFAGRRQRHLWTAKVNSRDLWSRFLLFFSLFFLVCTVLFRAHFELDFRVGLNLFCFEFVLSKFLRIPWFFRIESLFDFNLTLKIEIKCTSSSV